MGKRGLKLKAAFTADMAHWFDTRIGLVIGTRMGLFVRAFPRRNLIAIVIGVLLVGVPLIAFDFWLGGLIDRQGQAEVETSAKRAIALAESRVNAVIGALDGLAARGIASCSPVDIQAMRATLFDVIPIKELAIIGPDGQTLCSELGLPSGQRTVVSSEPLAGADGYLLDIVVIAKGQTMVRFRRIAGAGPNALAALVPAMLFIPQVSSQGGQFSAMARIETLGGMPIAKNAGRSQEASDDVLVGKAVSDKFGLAVEIVMSRDRVLANNSDLKWLGLFVVGAIVTITVAFTFLVPRRSAHNPVAELERALGGGQFVPYYQPIVDIRSGQLRGAEVLVRWRKPDGTLVLPGSFIPLAESSGLIREMTHDLMRRVCVEAGPVVGRRPSLKIAFNFAGQLFGDKSIVKDVRNIFFGSEIKLSQVVLELTERDPIENFTETRQVIAALQGLGIRIAIDDVGTGHSGLSYMLKLGVDIIKIDKMFVDAIGTDRNSRTIVETLVDLALNMRMDVVAEGVENFEQVMHLRELGIRSAQGYVFAPPLPGSAFLQLVEALDPLPIAATEEKPVGARVRVAAA
jgi:sensor c-di-GMP phosphodiesterase-like protein